MKRVFISYSHDSDAHCRRVRALAEQLRGEPGVAVVIDWDMLPGGPAEGWPQWSERQVIEADLVLVACTAPYGQRYEGNQPFGEGLGAVCEAAAIRQSLYERAGCNHYIRVVLFDAIDDEHIPTQLKRYHFFVSPRDQAALVDWLHGKPSSAAGLKWPSLPDSSYVWPLADRRPSCSRFEEAITGSSRERILLVDGPSNCGKTALLEALYAYAQHLGVAAVHFNFKGCPTVDDLFHSLKLDLGPAILPQACRAAGTARLYELIADLQQLAAPLLLILDTWEQASAEAQDWIEKQLLPRIDKAPAVVVVIAGQRVPDAAGRAWASAVASCPLSSILSVDDWLAFARERLQCPGIQRLQVETLTVVTDGVPGPLSALLSKLAQSASPTEGRGA
ncbi:SEFIR domain-containing protein [Candidatus Accumulibacter sp. ACC003]|uniref:SEFIR domain-containing protein n=1 Tax=Candidatus Accumulibacter sp. ACC003 TaxID=2823334 RepID=UPI0025B95087|nr:SEFIR domain-containing protein [Candidatus Accumulibacter sp. ACC003]